MELPELQLSFWPILFLMAGGQSLFFSVLILTKGKGNRLSNLYLSLILLLFGYMLFFHFCWWTYFNYRIPHVILTNLPIYYCLSPLLLLYLDSNRQKPQLQKLQWLHFLPAVLILLYLFPFYFQSGADKIAVIEGELKFPKFGFTAPLGFMANYKFFGSQMAIYLIWKIWLLYKIRTEDRQQIPDKNIIEIRQRWFRFSVILYAVYGVSFIAYFPLSAKPFFTNTHDFIISGFMTISIYVIGWLGWRRDAIFSGELLSNVFQSEKYATSTLTESAVDSIRKTLLELMESDKPYRDNELKIGTLADKLQVTSHHLSQVINDQFGKTFNQFINDFRIREAEELLRNPKHEKTFINQIGFEVGFNNKTTFYAAFKKKNGKSPAQFRQEFYK